MASEAAVRVWTYPWWLKGALAALCLLTGWGAFAATWPGVLAIYGYGAPLLTAWACLEAFRRRLTLTTTHLESRDMLGGLRRLALEDLVQISYSWRPALTVIDAGGNMIEVPRLFGGIRAIAESIAAAASAQGVKIERITPPRSS